MPCQGTPSDVVCWGISVSSPPLTSAKREYLTGTSPPGKKHVIALGWPLFNHDISRTMAGSQSDAKDNRVRVFRPCRQPLNDTLLVTAYAEGCEMPRAHSHTSVDAHRLTGSLGQLGTGRSEAIRLIHGAWGGSS